TCCSSSAAPSTFKTAKTRAPSRCGSRAHTTRVPIRPPPSRGPKAPEGRKAPEALEAPRLWQRLRPLPRGRRGRSRGTRAAPFAETHSRDRERCPQPSHEVTSQHIAGQVPLLNQDRAAGGERE